jgi:integrase
MSFTKDGRSYNRSTGTEDKAIAQKIYDILKGKIAIGQWHPETVKEEKKEYTFRELKEKYSAWAAGRQKSWKGARGYMAGQLERCFGKYDLNAFSSGLIEQFQSDELERGLNPGGVNRLVGLLKSMFTKALDWEMIREDVLRKVRKVKDIKGEQNRLRYLVLEECRDLVEACDTHLKPIVITALNTGMRRGEILGLKWEQVDLKHGFILLKSDDTKNGERRELPINATLRTMLQGIPRRLDIPYVFFDPATGNPYGEVKRSFKSALRRAKIQDFHFHDLRHTFASHLVMAGVDLTTVKELLGHKNITTTLRYAHLAPAHKVKAMVIYDQVFNGKSAEKEADYYDFTTLSKKG